MRESPHHLIVRYLGTVIGAIAAVWLRFELEPSFLDRVPFLLPFLVVLGASWFAGFGPALAAIVLSVAFATLYPALGWIDLDPTGWEPALLRFGLATVVMAFLIDRLQRGARSLRSESERRRSEVAQLAAIVENSDDAIIGTTLDGVITSWNAAAERLYQHRAQDVIGRSISLIVPPERAHETGQVIERLERGQSTDHFETVRMRQDGSRVEVATTISPILDAAGNVIGSAAITRDVSERRRIEEALRESEERYRGIVSHAAVAIARFGLDGELLDVNPGLAAALDYPRADLLGKRFLPLVHAEDWDAARGAIDALLAGGPDGQSLDLRYCRSDGDCVWMSVTFSAIRGAGGEPRSIVAAALDVTRRRRTESTLRFLAEASESLSALVDYRSTLQKVARLAVPDFADWCAVDMVGEDGTIERLAVAHVDPLKVELANELNRRFPPDPESRFGVSHVLRTGRSERVAEITDEALARSLPDPEPRRFVVELGVRSYMCVPLLAPDRVLGVISFVAAESGRRYDPEDLEAAEDLARRAAIAIDNARLYQELRDSDRRKDEFLAVLSHELRNPLAPIRSGIDMLAMGGARAGVVGTTPYSAVGAEDGATELIELMRQQVEHLVRLVDDLLDLSRITRGRVELKRERVELRSLLERTAAAMRGTLEGREQTLEVNAADEPLVVDGDPVRLLQVLENLLQNASKFSDAGSRIELRATKIGDHATIRVRDEGIGLDNALLPRLFEPFAQAPRSIDRAQGGLGVGLALVRGLVERHGGTVTASSAGPGLGSEFEVRLPLAARAAAAVATDDRRPAAGAPLMQAAAGDEGPLPGGETPYAHVGDATRAASGSNDRPATGTAQASPRGGVGRDDAAGRRVLVVDDNVAAAQMLSLLVSRLGGHQVDIAHDGPSAIEKVRSTHPEIVLLDIGLPAMDGYQVGRAIREDKRFDDILIVALTGYGQEEDRRRSRDAGFDEHLVKPAAVEDLERVLLHPKLLPR